LFTLPSDLKRYPVRPTDPLQAWDAADELILIQLGELGADALRGRRVLILNDDFGALSAALSAPGLDLGLELTAYTDSFVSAQGIALNTQGRVKPIHALSDLTGHYDLLLVQIPKNSSFLEDQLAHASQYLTPGALVISGFMIKHQAKASFAVINRVIGETRTSLARKKARLILANFTQAPTTSPYPLRVSINDAHAAYDLPFVNHSNLFSREKLDIGTRFLLQYLPQGDYPVILDLGCANGIVGIEAKRLNPASRVIFADDSWMAVESARANYAQYFGEPETAETRAQFLWTNCFENQPAESVDLVICNPPFHHGNSMGDSIAWSMFTDARHALRSGGTLLVIGNTHLKYQLSLRQIFGNHQVVATNDKFAVIDAIKD
jgi:16S rRNA G1207 methylase RsmC